MADTISSTSPERASLNAMRNTDRQLDGAEIATIDALKDAGGEFLATLGEAELVTKGRAGRELALARTKIEEAVMWAVKGVTGS